MQSKVADILKLISRQMTNMSYLKSLVIAIFVCLSIGVFVLMQATYPTIAHADANQNNINSSQSWRDGNLVIDMSPALCRLNGNYLDSIQCKEASRYSIHGLELKKNCHGTTKPKLSPLQANRLRHYMPDEQEQIRAWQKNASCNNITASRYFRQIIQQSSQLQLPSVLIDGRNHVVKKNQIMSQLLQENQGLNSSSVQLSCQTSSSPSSKGYPVLTQIKVCYKNGQFSKCQNQQSAKQSCGESLAVLGN